jgi:hypothetical protein
MRVESSVTSVSWIPREAIEGYTRLPWDLGIAHYDLPPPDVLADLEGLLTSDAARFANELRGWIEVQDGQITDYGQAGRGHIGNTRMRLAGVRLQFWAVSFPDLRPEPEVGDGWVRFVQTAGGRPGMPVPRRVRDRPYLRIVGPTVWSTLALTIRADGSSDFEVVGASSFPRHWIYDHAGRLAAKTGLIDFHKWHLEASPQHSPWGDEESPAIVTAAESTLERQLSRLIIGANPHSGGCGRASLWSSKASQATSCFCCLTASWPSRWTARRSPRSGRARSSVRWRCCRSAGGPPPCGR